MKSASASAVAENILFLKEIEKALSSARVLSPKVEAEILVRHFTKMDRLDLFTGKKNLRPAAKRSIRRALKIRQGGTPLSHITGECGFYGHNFFVTKDTLIPRPETELLVEEALSVLKQNGLKNPHILDVGTGSGCISVSLTIARPDCRITALDFSGKALKVARKNVRFHGLVRKIKLVKSDLFCSIGAKKRAFWDLIVSNPPYIPKDQIKKLSREVRSEPVSALDGGKNGLRIIESILEEAPLFLKKDAWLLMEIGAGQSKALAARLSKDGSYKNFCFKKDLNHIDRILIAQKA